MARRIADKTLRAKISKWKKTLKMSDWTIKAKFVPPHVLKENPLEFEYETVAYVKSVYPDELVAEIEFNSRYYEVEGYKLSWNIDTIIIHELIHVLLHEKTEAFHPSTRESSKLYNYEEFICNSFSKIIYDQSKKKSS